MTQCYSYRRRGPWHEWFRIRSKVRDDPLFRHDAPEERLTGQKGWNAQWPDAQPKDAYDVAIVSAGGHGLGAAYYLAGEHGITDVAVIEKAGSAGAIPAAIPRSSARTTSMITRSTSGGLAEELKYNVMFSRRA